MPYPHVLQTTVALLFASVPLGCASAVTPLSEDAPPASDASVEVAPPTCTSGHPSSPEVTGGFAASDRCPDARHPSPQPANAPHIRGFSVSAPCGCATGVAVDLDVTDPDTPRDALRTCMAIMDCAASSNAGAAPGASFWTACQGSAVGSWLITVVDPQGNHDSVGGYVEDAVSDPLRCAPHVVACDGSVSTPVAGANRGCE